MRRSLHKIRQGGRRLWQRTIICRFLDRITIRRFHKIAYYRELWRGTQWLGRQVMQYPSDLLVKQDVIYRVRPDLLIECGTLHGGSALFYATIFEMMGRGRVLTIDNNPKPDLPVHPRIEYLHASSTSNEALQHVQKRVAECGGVIMVTLDSLHRQDHVSRELELYHRFVSRGSYLIVEDSEINGHPVHTEHEPDIGSGGPYEAIEEFLASHREFEADHSCERYLVTSHPNGFLRRTA
jgi:cephalosporin hydroxylase